MREQHGPKEVFALQEPVETLACASDLDVGEDADQKMDGDVQKEKERSKCSESLQKLKPEAQQPRGTESSRGILEADPDLGKL